MGGTSRVDGKDWNSPGEDLRKLSLLAFTPPMETLACVHRTCLFCAWSIYHSVSNTFSPLCCFVCHPSLGSIESSAEPSPHTLIIRLWIVSFAKCNKWTRVYFSFREGWRDMSTNNVLKQVNTGTLGRGANMQQAAIYTAHYRDVFSKLVQLDSKTNPSPSSKALEDASFMLYHDTITC